MPYQFVTRCAHCATQFGTLWVMDWTRRVGPNPVARITCPLCGKRFYQDAKDLRYPVVATAGVQDSSDVRPARVRDLSIAAAYLAMPNPFSRGASIFVKIRTDIEFFQSRATVAHSAEGLGMTVMFYEVSPPFLLVLRRWILDATHAG